MLIRIAVTVIVMVAFSAVGAFASAGDGSMTASEVRALPDFVADDYSLSGAMTSGEPDAVQVYSWIGYIPQGDKRVYYTSNGEPLTCVQWEATGEWVPEWVVEALRKLVDGGYITI